MRWIALLIAGLAQASDARPAPTAPGGPASAAQTVVYTPDESDFPNPERGFSLSRGTPAAARAANLTLLHVYFRLDRFRASPISARYLRSVQRRFDEARRGGVKLVPRFTYNFPKGLPLAPGDEDAPLPVVLRHIAQLEPLLRRNADVIAFLEAGFVGAWGEWHHSTSGLDSPAAKAAILRQLLKALPRTRSVALRYARDKIATFGEARPLAPSLAFTGQGIARVGHHNDCFLAAPDDWGTYREQDGGTEAQKAYLAADNRYVPQGGETCNAGDDAQPFIPCANAVPELERLHFSQLNADYQPDVLALWRRQGCFELIARRLGYRIRLISAAFPKAARPGATFQASIVVANDGFAAPYNPRAAELILRERGSGRKTVVALPVDPRRWAAGETTRVAFHAALPRSLPPGLYDLLLNLPDPAPALHPRPEYSIRLANRGTWEAATGYNRLLMTLEVRR